MTELSVNHLRTMWRIRAFEERVRALRIDGQISGSVHLCIGQEAIPTGAVSALRRGTDVVFSTYRGHGWAIACGSDLTQLFAELLGRVSGVNSGRGGSAYLSDPDRGFLGENSIVAAGVPHALGAALAGRFDGSDRVALTSFGDGAVSQGAWHESMNMAAALRLPVIFMLENNRYSELTPIEAMVGNPELWSRAAGYGIEGQRVDGNDPAAVAEAVAYARDRAVAGKGPSLIEAMTERLVGHYIGDAEQYRPEGEVERAWSREPLTMWTKYMMDAGHSIEWCKQIQSEEREAVQLAEQAALEADLPDWSTAGECLYAG